MAFCSNCGTELEENAKFCANCGAAVYSTDTDKSNKTDFSAKVAALNDTPDYTAEMDQQDINDNKIISILSYISILVLIPIFAVPGSKFTRFHANQGLLLFVLEIALGVVKIVLRTILLIISWRLASIVNLLAILDIAFLVLAVIGIVNAANGVAKELPIIGKFKILK